MSRRTQAIAASRLGPAASAVLRTGIGLRHLAGETALVGRWLWRSREHTNLTYELTDVNRQHLAWWVSGVTGVSVQTADEYLRELETDSEFKEHVAQRTHEHPRGRFADSEVRLHKRLGWYALARALRPEVMVETGTDKGLGAIVLAAAARRNGHGTVVTVDINPDSGYLIAPPYSAWVDRQIGDSVTVLTNLTVPVDFFLHDSLHTFDHETAEFRAIEPHLSETAFVLSDYAHASSALPEWAMTTGRRFSFFGEIPRAHWFAGEGIGVAYK